MDEKYDAWLNLGYFFASQLREKTLKTKNSSKKLFDFFPNNLSFGKKKIFFEKDSLTRRTLRKFWEKTMEEKISASIFTLSCNWHI